MRPVALEQRGLVIVSWFDSKFEKLVAVGRLLQKGVVQATSHIEWLSDVFVYLANETYQFWWCGMVSFQGKDRACSTSQTSLSIKTFDMHRRWQRILKWQMLRRSHIPWCSHKLRKFLKLEEKSKFPPSTQPTGRICAPDLHIWNGLA